MSSPQDSGCPQQGLGKYFQSTFVSLKHPNFRLYCLGVIMTLTGCLLQEVVVAWLAYQKTGSSFVLGSILFSFQMPMIILGAAGGYVADRFDRRKVLLHTQTLALCVSFVWLTLSYLGKLELWHMYALAALFGSIVAFEIPSRFAMIPQLVEDADCMNAFSLDGLLFFTGRVMGPALGALVLSTFGATVCFALNSFSYMVELSTLAIMKPKVKARCETVSLKEGFAYTWGNAKVRRVLILVAALTFGGVYIPLMPVFTHLLHGDVRTNGLLIAVSELGAMIGSVFLARKTASAAYANTLKRTVGWAAIAYCVCLALFSMSHLLPLSLVLIMGTGFCMTFVLIGSHALVQSEVEDRMRGMVSTVFWMYSYFGMLALGGPALGFLVQCFGASVAISGTMCCCLVIAIYYLKHTKEGKVS